MIQQERKSKPKYKIKVPYFWVRDINDCQVKIDLTLIWQKQHKTFMFCYYICLFFFGAFTWQHTHIHLVKLFERRKFNLTLKWQEDVYDRVFSCNEFMETFIILYYY